MKIIIITKIFIFYLVNVYSQQDTLKLIYDVKKWRCDYVASIKIGYEDSVSYMIPKHFLHKKYNNAEASDTEGALTYLTFDSLKSSIYDYQNFTTLYDEKRAIAYDEVVDSLVLSSKANFTLTRIDSRLFLLLTNYQDVLGGSQTDKHLIEEIIYISHEALILLDKDGYLSVYTNDHIPRGKSSLEKDDYFLVNVLTNYFKSKNLLYKVEDNEIIKKSLEEIHGKN